MMDWTDVWYRGLARLLTRRARLYTEMVVDQTLVQQHRRGDTLERFLGTPAGQAPCALQLGGWDPEGVARAAALAAPFGFDEINLNCGCPSPKVAGGGGFGAALMADPGRVRRIVEGAQAASGLPVTVKCRIGVDSRDSYAELQDFVGEVSRAWEGGAGGAGPGQGGTFIVHARKALLDGLSPAENRTVPPLRRGWAFALARDFPHLRFVLNGEASGAAEAARLLEAEAGGAHVAGVMIGRAAYQTPWHALADVDRRLFPGESNPCANRRELLLRYAEWCDGVLEEARAGSLPYGRPSVSRMAMPLNGLLYNEPGAALWRRALHDHRKHCETMGELVAEVLGSCSSRQAEVLEAAPPRGWPAPAEASPGADLRLLDVPGEAPAPI